MRSSPLHRRLGSIELSLRLVPEPPAPPVGGLMHRDSVNPGLQAGLAVKMLHPPKHFQKNFLGRIGRVRGIGHDAIYQTVDGLVEFAN